ncbi:arf-GAP with Rho-GAP domain, ANK repeat and PH domain-containing protein 2-like [Topomyia yanbarensis]|uniref:arf-GAP with Rho-GAP domain, ANK repeat and PH domain-containing protein 2-like n=1 Tax=Topomyia yanbarensis TaxID=2498891 RepID=UPI00273CAD81|nr:arf-GAP with Rho-GAP domain, ANK repeat and PH domain-containing protein 2-like [Topomyia yanbarensis]
MIRYDGIQVQVFEINSSAAVQVHPGQERTYDDVEQLVDDAVAVIEETTISQEPVDLSYPSSSQGPQTRGFVMEAVARINEKSKVDPVIEKASKPVENNRKELPSELTCIGEDDTYLPSYLEAICGDLLHGSSGPSGGRKPSVRLKLVNALKRKSSFKEKSDVWTVLEMVPKPLMTMRFLYHRGNLLMFPPGMIGHVPKKLTPQSVVLSGKIIQTYNDPQSVDLRFILSLQCLAQHNFNSESLDLHCFEVVLAHPIEEKGSTANMQAGSHPNLVITSTNSGNVKSLRQSYMFGVHERQDRNVWAGKILQSVTRVFPDSCLAEFTRAGWCYMKKSVSSGWSGAWLLLAKRRLYFYNYQDHQLEQLDLRKARCIGAIESEESIRNLHIEAGPSLFIDCPPYARLYFIMNSPRETGIWRRIMKNTAHKNGTSLHSQQLTRNDVPVLIDKCINFISAHGSMSEGIYRTCGSSSQINKILQLFKEDAFAVQLTHAEFNEADVAGALKKFIRDIPNSLFGDYSVSFVSIANLKSTAQSLELHNKMGIPNLAMIWGSTLMASSSHNLETEQYSYSKDEADMVTDLIKLYEDLFTITPEEVKKEQLMMQELQKFHTAAENLSDSVQHSGDLKVWITIDCDDGGTVVGDGATGQQNAKTQIKVTITTTKTASDICKELAAKTGFEWYNLTLYEVIAEGALIRPVHHSERALEIVLKWTYWDEADRETNYLSIRPNTTLNEVYRHIKECPILTPTTELNFADRCTKTLLMCKILQIGREIIVLKQTDKKDKTTYEELMKIDLRWVHAYLGREAKRGQPRLRWAITLVDHDFKKRSQNAPFIGHLLEGVDFSDQILWYSSIFYSLHKDDILPSSDQFP